MSEQILQEYVRCELKPSSCGWPICPVDWINAQETTVWVDGDADKQPPAQYFQDSTVYLLFIRGQGVVRLIDNGVKVKAIKIEITVDNPWQMVTIQKEQIFQVQATKGPQSLGYFMVNWPSYGQGAKNLSNKDLEEKGWDFLPSKLG